MHRSLITFAYRTPKDLERIERLAKRKADAVIPPDGTPPLGSARFLRLSLQQKMALARAPKVRFTSELERMRAEALHDLLVREANPLPELKRSGQAPRFINEYGSQADDADADAAQQQFKRLGLRYGYRAVRHAYGPRVIDAAQAESVYEGSDYYHFGYASQEAMLAANDRVEALAETIEAEARQKEWEMIVAGCPIGGRKRWMILAARAFAADRYTATHTDGTESDVCFFYYSTEQEAREAEARVRAAPEFEAGMATRVGHNSQLAERAN